MKSITTLFTIGFFLSLLTGCEKPSAESEPLKNPTIEAWSDFSSIPYNESCTVTLKSTNTTKITSDFPGSENITLNEEPKSIDLSTPKLTETTTYHFVAHGVKGLTDSASVTIIVNDPPPPPPPPAVTISANPYTVIRGKTTTISWNVTGEVDSVRSDLPGIFTKFGSITISPTESRLITVTAYGKGGITSDTATITVIDPPPPPPPTMEELLSVNYGPWKKIKLEFQNAPGLPWVEAGIWDCMKDDLLYFYLIPSKKGVQDNGENRCGSESRTQEGSWSLTGNIITGLDCEILTLTKDTLVWVYVSGGGPGRVRETFVHP